MRYLALRGDRGRCGGHRSTVVAACHCRAHLLDCRNRDIAGLIRNRTGEPLFDYWTLKEAYCKARGMGLLLPLQQFSMLIESDGKIGIAFAPDFGDDSARWSFVQTSPSPRHRLAVADGSGLPGRKIVIQSWLPCFQQ
jgi:hypothetical protein